MPWCVILTTLSCDLRHSYGKRYGVREMATCDEESSWYRGHYECRALNGPKQLNHMHMILPMILKPKFITTSCNIVWSHKFVDHYRVGMSATLEESRVHLGTLASLRWVSAYLPQHRGIHHFQCNPEQINGFIQLLAPWNFFAPEMTLIKIHAPQSSRKSPMEYDPFDEKPYDVFCCINFRLCHF
ncbi:hypothetical protein F5Y15DRAFT_191057 [Xylariaceae sp. FL0016]|nr:hypothetical protein F5Y15DRAFT_191057 [Xylariaceae sp. FL0016]